jgi:hypothetical protein
MSEGIHVVSVGWHLAGVGLPIVLTTVRYLVVVAPFLLGTVELVRSTAAQTR